MRVGLPVVGHPEDSAESECEFEVSAEIVVVE